MNPAPLPFFLVRDLTPQDSRSSFEIPFRLDRDAERLEISFSYEPKEFADRKESLRMVAACLDRSGNDRTGAEEVTPQPESFLPLSNLITLSLDREGQYIGCAHRHDPVQFHRIGLEGSSPGFLTVPVLAGLWRLVVSVHCILNPLCRMRVSVVARGAKESS